MLPEKIDQRDIRMQLERVLSSAEFTRSERLSQFLRFVVEQHLAGKDEEIKESLIAVEVFGRRPDYDPKRDSIVRTEAGRLRARLNEYYAVEGCRDPIVIEMPKGGYAPVLPPSAEAPAVENAKPKVSHWRPWPAVALAGLILTLAGAGWWWVQNSRAPIPVAVLPLENLNHDPASDYFADGLTDELIRNLSIIDGLAVRSQTSSFALKGNPRDLAETGKQLKVDYILEGSVLRAGQQLRIDVQLVRVRDDVPIWSGRFNRELTDVFAIQDEISRGIVNNLRLTIGRGRRRYETSVEAYDLYLRARALAMRGGIRGTVQSIGAFERVIAKDPSFAPAYASLGAAYAIRSIQFPVDHPADELSKMRAAAERAAHLDPLLAEAHEAAALVDARDGQWEQAEASFREAVRIDPNRSSTRANFALWLLWVLGRNQEALQQLRIAERMDPLSPEVQSALAFVLISTGRYDEALGHCLKMSTRDLLRGRCLARAMIGEGRLGEAIPYLAVDRNPDPEGRGFLGYVQARSGHCGEAEKLAAAAAYSNEQALIFAGLQDKDRTLEALDRMAVLGPQRIGMYLNYPEMAWLRSDPRVKALRRKVGLPV